MERGASRYVVLERFCPNPECDCREVHLAFFPLHRDSANSDRHVVSEEIMAKMTLDGQVRLDEVHGVRRTEAQAVISQWRREEMDDLGYLGWRYEQMKAVGRRSLAGKKRRRREAPEMDFIPEETEPLEPASARVGRNSPCPCGSGKKYKKCCGPKKGADA